MAAKRPQVSRGTRLRLGGCECGDVVRRHALLYVVFGVRQDRAWTRRVDEQYREISEPIFLDPDLQVEIVRRGVERYAPANGGSYDPLRGEN